MSNVEEAAILLANGVEIYILTKYGTSLRSVLLIDRKDPNIEAKLFWRSNMYCEMSHIQAINPPLAKTNKFSLITIKFKDFDLQFEIYEHKVGFAENVYKVLLDVYKKAIYIRNLEKDYKAHKQSSSSYLQSLALNSSYTEATLREEQLLQMITCLKFKEGYLIMEKFSTNFTNKVLNAALSQWIRVVKQDNGNKMMKDRERWRLHAASNQEIDLQAWYHALFYQEVYRLRGHFWYKDAVLPSYRHSYDLVDNALTQLEEAALAHVLCSPNTTYGDVAGQMFVVQAVVTLEQFTLFQQLAAQGAQVVKHPRSGRPAKKLFRFSFVEGNIYLTWKGKFGNQGVGMGEVTAILGGIQTDILRWSGQPGKAEQYLSVICADRSIDLYFENEQDRNSWRELLLALVAKEQGKLSGVEPVESSTINDFDWSILYASIGKVRRQIANNTNT